MVGYDSIQGYLTIVRQLSVLTKPHRRSEIGVRRDRAMRSYLIGAVVIWVGIVAATALVASDRFGQMIPILGGGAFWFIVLAPNLFRDEKTRG